MCTLQDISKSILQQPHIPTHEKNKKKILYCILYNIKIGVFIFIALKIHILGKYFLYHMPLFMFHHFLIFSFCLYFITLIKTIKIIKVEKKQKRSFNTDKLLMDLVSQIGCRLIYVK